MIARDGWWMRRAPAWALAALSCVLIARSVWFVLTFATPQAFFDFWFWVSDFQLWDDGRFTLHDLLKPHYGQHRIATTRVLLLLDSVFFDMNGLSVLLVNLALLAGIGLLIRRLVRLDGVAGTGWDLPAPFWVALLVAVCQVENLIYPFQVQFALTCFFGVAASSVLAAATRPGQPKAGWLAAGAGALGILAAFSMASGVLVTPGLLVLLALRRARLLVWAVFVPISAAGVAAFFHHYPSSIHPPLLNAYLAGLRVLYIGNFLASSMTGFPAAATIAGLVALMLFLAAVAALGWRFVRRGVAVPEGDAALAGVGVFVALCGPAATMTVRLLMGPDKALVSRYATMSLLFAAVLFGLGARWGARWGAGWGAGQGQAKGDAGAGARARPGWLRDMGMPAAAAAVLLLLNAPVYDLMGRGLNGVVTADTQLLRNNVGIAGPVPVLFDGTVDDVRGQIRFLHDGGLNIFSAAEAPPSGLLAGLAHADLARLPACRGSVDDAYAIDDSAFLVRGWLAGASGTMDWVAALDSGGHVLGLARALAKRPDVQAVLGTRRIARGFETGFRLRAPRAAPGAPVQVRIAGLDEHGAAPVCLLPGPVTIGPLLFPPATALRDMVPAHAAPPSLEPADTGFVPWHGIEQTGWLPRDYIPGGSFAGASVWRAPPGGSAALIRFVLPGQTQRVLAIPFAMIGGSPGSHVTVRFADGSFLDSTLPWIWDRLTWRAAVVPATLLAAHGGAVAVEVRAQGSSALFTGVPMLATLAPDWARLF